jgi:glycosyltransferase involved in cell wall biosynthesis
MCKSIKIGFYLPNGKISNVNWSTFNGENLGVGGSLHHLVAIPYFLSKRFSHYQITIYSDVLFDFTNNIKIKKISSFENLLTQVNDDSLDCLVIWENNKDKLSYLCQTGLNIALYSQNFIWDKDTLDRIAQSKNIKAYVPVGREMLDFIRDHRIIKKSYVLNNGIVSRLLNDRIKTNTKDNIVCYVGSIVQSKGFHLLAKNWKHVISVIPNARLHVIGSGSLYDHSKKLGKYGLAEESYENHFMPFLTDNNGKILPSVNFFGSLGLEKYETMERAKVGVVNPTGQTETFCISGVEFQALGVPVVSRRYIGLMDTIKNKKTGMLIKKDEELAEAIIQLLTNDRLRIKLGNNAVKYSQKFDFDIVINKWNELFTRIYENKSFPYQTMKTNIFYKKKWLKELVRVFNLNMSPILGKGWKKILLNN